MRQRLSLYGYIILAVTVITSVVVLSNAYKYKYKAQESISVTGLGEESFTSDIIVWSGQIVVETQNVELGYAELERQKALVSDFIIEQGVSPESTTFDFVNVNKEYESCYSNGNYVGQSFSGYTLMQPISIESGDVETVEHMSRNISSLIAQGVSLEAYSPSYYYSKLEDLKLSLIEKASSDAYERASKIAAASGAELDGVLKANMGVFQITGAYSNEEYSAGGSLNTSSRNKKARITMRIEYKIK